MTFSAVIERPLRIAFIGGGRMALNHLSAIQSLPTAARVVGVVDSARGTAEHFAALAGADAVESIEALLEAARPDVVHVCTPPASHFDAARRALDWGAHVYVEKPFALTGDDAGALLALASARGRLVCAGHQLLRDPAFEQLTARVRSLGAIVHVDSHFAFRPIGPPAARRNQRALADQAVDILPHPLYTLVDVLERFGPPGAAIELDWAQAGSADLQAILRAGDIVGRLSVSLRARPIASSLTIVGTRSSLTCDFVRSIVVGAGNAGTQPLEKIFNPIVEGTQQAARTLTSVGRRVRSGEGYPGLQGLIQAFYGAVASGAESPVTPDHLLRVTGIFERLVASINSATDSSVALRRQPPRTASRPPTVVTGARGFLGAEVARALGRVRGIGRGIAPDDPHVTEWHRADLSRVVPTDVLREANVVIHAAAETSGGYEAHQRNSIDATRHLLEAMSAAGVSRLVLVSSLSVIRPPRTPWERQSEATPRLGENGRVLGPYTWGKSLQEALVEREAPRLGIETRIVRPGALVDFEDPELPGLMGRHLYGRWHLGLGRPALPIAVCGVKDCANAIAWIATHFEEAPATVNLFDPAVATRADLLSHLRQRGWTGRMVWVPISVLSLGISAARAVVSLSRGQRPDKLATWSLLRPRRFDARVASEVVEAGRLAENGPIALRA